MDDWAWDHVARWTEHRIQLPSVRCSASSPARPADAAGQRPLRAVSFAASRRRLGCGGGSRRTSSGMPTRSRWRTKGSRCRLSSGNSGMHNWDTSIYLQGIDTREIVDTVHHRRPPVIPASAGLRR